MVFMLWTISYGPYDIEILEKFITNFGRNMDLEILKMVV